MRLASRLRGDDLEERKGCISDEGRVRGEAGKGGLFSMTRTVDVRVCC